MRRIEIRKKEFLVDGKPTCFRSGSMHYFRIHPDLWMDRLVKLKQCGLNTVESYLPWNLHEEREGSFPAAMTANSCCGDIPFVRAVYP